MSMGIEPCLELVLEFYCYLSDDLLYRFTMQWVPCVQLQLSHPPVHFHLYLNEVLVVPYYFLIAHWGLFVLMITRSGGIETGASADGIMDA